MTELGLRDMMPWDAEWLFKITGDPRATRYMGLKRHESIDDAAALLKTYAISPTKFMAIVPRSAPAELIGVVGCEMQGHQAAVTIKLNLHDRRARGAGRKICTPFVRGLLAAGAWRVWCFVHVDNIPSQRVVERSGAVREGLMRRYAIFPNISDTEPQNCFLYALVR